jgi:uncharacterized protein (DUF1501 family)
MGAGMPRISRMLTMEAGNTALKIDPARHHTLVVIFLRGGADGLNMVVPAGDDGYYRARPLIGISRSDTVPLDDLFGLNSALAPLQRAYGAGDLLIVHGAGSEESSRSHFEAQDYMEHGGLGAGGWLGRYLRQNTRAGNNPLAAVAFGKRCPESLRSSPAAVVMDSIQDIALGNEASAYLTGLEQLYGASRLPWAKAGQDLIGAMRRIESLQARSYHPNAGVEYPQTPFGLHLCQVAQLIKAEVGVEAATLDLDGWDSHIASAALMNPLMTQLAAGLMAFYDDLGVYRNRTSVVVMTEFGRRVYENASLGTDHGRGSVMMVLGGGVQGGRVLADWPGLEMSHLEEPGDLPVQFNYRDILAPVFQRHLPDIELQAIFPGYTLNPVETA